MYKGSSLFWYNAPFRTLLQSSEQSFTLQTQSDADFECQYLMSNACLSLDNVTTFPTDTILNGLHYSGILLQVVDENSGDRWFSEPTSMVNVCGTAQCPSVLPQTKLISRSTSLHVTLINLYTGRDFPLLNITFFGRKLYT